MSPSSNSDPTRFAPSAPADNPSSPTPTMTPPTASHSRPVRRIRMSQAANTAVTARLAAIIAWTANNGSRRSATSWATKPSTSIMMLPRNSPWRSIRTSRPVSTPCPAWPTSATLRLLAARTLMACSTEAMP